MSKECPTPSTPYERMLWQQNNCINDISGYAVGIASERTERAAYLTAGCDLTNDERSAAILSKDEASAMMSSLLEQGWYRKSLWKIAFLVPVSDELPLTNCTFQGH